MRLLNQAKRGGFSLIELAIVVMILAIIAGIVIPLAGGLSNISTPTGAKSDRLIITETKMRAVRDAILGTDLRPGAWADLGQRAALFPTLPGQLVAEVHPTVGSFDPLTKIGWRGPYLQGANRQSDGSSVFNDGWGNPLTIFVPDVNNDSIMGPEDIRYARLVSCGENGILETLQKNTEDYMPGGLDPTIDLSLEECGDDVLLFFFVPDNRQ